MGIYAQLVDYDEEFARLDVEPIVVNDYNTSIPEEKEALDQHLFTHYQDTDTIDEAASCDCGALTGVYRIGITCRVCNTQVYSTTDRPIQSMLWIRAPEEVPRLINPEVWMILEQALRVKDFNFLEYLTNTTYRFDPDKITSKETNKKLEKLLAANLPRGFNNFINHFDEIMDFLFTSSIIDSNKANKGELKEFIQQNRHLFFPKYLPIPSRICFVVESTNSGVYIDKPLGMAMDAVLTVSSIRSTAVPMRQQVVENRVAKAIRELAGFYDAYMKQRLSKKPGMFRRHVFGSRLHFSARCVITSLSDPHHWKELHVPWGMATQLLKYHIINKLLKRGYTANEALNFVYSNVLRYNAELDEIFKELIAEAEGIGLPVMFSRNPTLQRGSMQQFYITKVKTDVHVNTVSMSVLTLKSPNADFDGDQLNLILILDNQMRKATERLTPHLWVLSPDDPHTISGNLELQGPVVDTVVNWLHEDYLPA